MKNYGIILICDLDYRQIVLRHASHLVDFICLSQYPSEVDLAVPRARDF